LIANQLLLPLDNEELTFYWVEIMKLNTLFSLVAVAATLAACGGGGADSPVPVAGSVAAPPASTADKYVGSWTSCGVSTGATNGVLSTRLDYVFTKTSETVLTMSLNGARFKAANCAGDADSTFTGLATGTVTLNGSKTVGADTVDRLNFVSVAKDIPELDGSFKDIGLVSGNKLKLGARIDTGLDTDGYPTALSVGVFIKQ
jgi:hypothetical protein